MTAPSDKTSGGMTHDQFRDRIVDYLYGTLDEDGRKAFETAMVGSEPWRREVDDLARTLRISRSTLAAAREPAPGRVHANVLAAAERKAAEMARRANAVAAGGGGLLETISAWLRQPWAVPALAAAAAIGVFVTVRGTMTPDKIDEAISHGVREARQAKTGHRIEAVADQEETAPEPASKTAPRPAPELANETADEGGLESGWKNKGSRRERKMTAVEVPKEREAPKKQLEEQAAAPQATRGHAGTGRDQIGGLVDKEADLDDGLTAPSKDVERRFAQPPADWNAKMAGQAGARSKAKAPAVNLMGPVGAVSDPLAKREIADKKTDSTKALDDRPAPFPVVSPPAAEASGAATGGDGFGRTADLARKPGSMAGRAAGGKGNAVPSEPASATGSAEPARASPSATAPPPPRAPAPRQEGAPSRRADESPAPGTLRPGKAATARDESEEAGTDAVAASVVELVRKADDLRKQGRFDEAVAIYRELIRRYPGDRLVPEWRRQLLVAQNAAARSRTASKAAAVEAAPARATEKATQK